MYVYAEWGIRTVNQEKLIHEEDWDILIVLDACRYDYFREESRGFLEGSLAKVRSNAFEGEGAATSSWYKNTFPGTYNDIIHVSGHPRINSKLPVDGYDARSHFKEIIDVWDLRWNDSYGTVFPEELTEKVLEVVAEGRKESFIVHYMQPHVPYITLEPPSVKTIEWPEKFAPSKVQKRLVRAGRFILSDAKAARIAESLGLSPLSPLDDTLRKVGPEGLKKAYRENLREALRSVQILVENTEESVVVTSDHGELLGEYGRFGHAVSSKPELVEVPWFRVER